MNKKNRHHYVPQFYLRQFASRPKRINVFHLGSKQAIPDVSLRDQCYKHRLHGKSPEVEDALAILEGKIAPVVRTIAANRHPPSIDTAEYDLLISFVALQLLRTTAAIKRVMRASEMMTTTAFKDSPSQAFPPLTRDESVALSLQMLPHMADALDDLAPHIVQVIPGTAFVASDNPVYRYNLYCEGIRGLGVTGGVCRGLMIFVPLSPEVTIILYDRAVYKLGKRGVTETSVATEEDLYVFNLMQFISAERNVYFSRWTDRAVFHKLAAESRQHRRAGRLHIQEAVEVDGDGSTLLHQYEQMPNLQLRLSFASVRRNARRLNRHARSTLVRKPLPDAVQVPELRSDGKRRTFRTL